MGGGRREDVAPVERATDARQTQVGRRQLERAPGSPREDRREEPVVGRHERGRLGRDHEAATRRADARIHDREVHRSGREEGNRRLENEGRSDDVV